MKAENLKTGMLVRIGMPADLDEYPYWLDEMDIFDGGTATITHTDLDQDDCILLGSCLYHISWLTETTTAEVAEQRVKQVRAEYQDKLLAIQTAYGMMEQELAEVTPNEVKLKTILSQIKCIAEDEGE